jgi:hypothetical protein
LGRKRRSLELRVRRCLSEGLRCTKNDVDIVR